MTRGIPVVAIIFLGNVYANIYKLPTGCTKNPIDIIFLLDGSGSVGNKRFGLMKDFVENLLLKLNVGESATKVGLMQFSGGDKTAFEFEINDYSEAESMRNAVRNINYHYGGLQETGVALKIIGTKVFNGSQATDRPWARNVVTLIAEGPSTFPDKALKEAKLLKERGVQMVTIGIGKRISTKLKNELNSLASSRDDVFLSNDENLMGLIDTVGATLCPNVSFCADRKYPTAPAVGHITVKYIKTHHVTKIHTSTKVITSYLIKPTTSLAVPQSSSALPTAKVFEETQKDKKTENDKKDESSEELTGKQLRCFECIYDEAVAKEFSIECRQKQCKRNEQYCADAVLEHDGRSFVRKSCATGQYCNSTTEQCVKSFKHKAEVTDCRVQCCKGKLCNPYNFSPSIQSSIFFCFFLPIIIPALIEHMM